MGDEGENQKGNVAHHALKVEDKGDKCRLAIFSTPGMQEWILGSPFFETASVILNYDVRRMGFAKYR